MFYKLFEYLNENTTLPGMRVGEYLSFRSAAAIITSLLISIFFGKRIIRFLRRQQIGEEIRDLGLQGQLEKRGTPTMGGIIIILAMFVPVLLFGDLSNVYIQLMLISTLWLGFIGGLDDYIKVFRHNKDGLKGRFKIVGQVGLGIIVGTTMWLSDDIVIHEKNFETKQYTITDVTTGEVVKDYTTKQVISTTSEKTTKTSIPFLKDTMLDYKVFTGGNETLAWLLYIVVAIFVITAVSNGANLTDGIDGLLTGVSVPIVLVLGVLAYLSGHILYSDYLNIMYIPDSGELIVFAAAFAGALIGFLWYNSFPAQVFMGDSGSLMLGGIIGVAAILIRKELLVPILCGIFFAESLSVLMQTTYFKYTRKKYGAGRRIFKMTPIHHHFQKEGIPCLIQSDKKAIPEAKIVTRFWIVGMILAVITIALLKIR